MVRAKKKRGQKKKRGPDLSSVWSLEEKRAWDLPRLDPIEFASEWLWLGSSAQRSGRFDIELTPYLKEPLRCLANPTVEEIDLCMAAQLGKTSFANIALTYYPTQLSQPAILCQPSLETVNDYIDEKLKPLIEASPKVRAELPAGDKRAITYRRIRWKRTSTFFAHAGSAAKVRSKSVPLAIGDEVDVWHEVITQTQEDPVESLRARLQTYYNKKLVLESTPKFKNRYIWTALVQGTFERFHVECPHCKARIVLEFDQLKYPKKTDPETIKVKNLVEYECQECEMRFDESHKRRLLAGGVWVPKDHELVKGDLVHSETGEVFDPNEKTKRSFHLNALYSPFLSWGEIIEKWFNAQGSLARLREFRNQVLALCWEQRVTSITDSKVESLQDKDLKPEVVPADTVLLTGGADYHTSPRRSPFFYVVRAWQPEERSTLILAEKCDRWDQLNAVMTRAFQTADGKQKYLNLCCVDSGWEPKDIYKWCKTNRVLYYPTKSNTNLDYSKLYFSSRPEHDSVTGKVREDSIVLWTINASRILDTIASMMDRGIFKIGPNVSEEYKKHLVSMHKIVETDKRGNEKYHWEKVHPGAETHFLACEQEAYAAAGILHYEEYRGPSLQDLPTGPTPGNGGESQRDFLEGMGVDFSRFEELISRFR